MVCPDPTAVFFGDRYYNHSDHRVTGWATLDAIAPAAGNPHYFPEQLAAGLAVHHVSAGVPVGHARAQLLGRHQRHIETKIDALFCHESQLVETGDWFRDFLRERAEDGGARRRRQLRRGLPPAVLQLLGIRSRRLPPSCHSAMARSTSTATTATPPAPTTRRPRAPTPATVPQSSAADVDEAVADGHPREAADHDGHKSDERTPRLAASACSPARSSTSMVPARPSAPIRYRCATCSPGPRAGRLVAR